MSKRIISQMDIDTDSDDDSSVTSFPQIIVSKKRTIHQVDPDTDEKKTTWQVGRFDRVKITQGRGHGFTGVVMGFTHNNVVINMDIQETDFFVTLKTFSGNLELDQELKVGDKVTHCAPSTKPREIHTVLDCTNKKKCMLSDGNVYASDLITRILPDRQFDIRQQGQITANKKPIDEFANHVKSLNINKTTRSAVITLPVAKRVRRAEPKKSIEPTMPIQPVPIPAQESKNQLPLPYPFFTSAQLLHNEMSYLIQSVSKIPIMEKVLLKMHQEHKNMAQVISAYGSNQKKLENQNQQLVDHINSLKMQVSQQAKDLSTYRKALAKTLSS